VFNLKAKRELYVDCGLNGAIAVVLDNVLTEVIRMPKNKDGIDWAKVQDIFGYSDYILLEQQFNPHEKAQAGAFTNASNFGGLKTLAVLSGADVPKPLDAKKWKGFHNLLNSPNRSKFLKKIVKTDSIILANRLFSLQIDVKPTLDGLGDALLIMNYDRRLKKQKTEVSKNIKIVTKQ